MAVASDEPLDLRRVRDYYDRRSVSWDPDLNVYGDPFRAMERFARMLVPDYDDGYGSFDWYSYSVGSTRYRFPRYACYDSYGAWYTSRSPYYDSCDRVRVLLVEVPYYYDTRYYHGDRSRYWGRWYGSDYAYRRGYNDGYRSVPQHGYKEGGYPYDRANGYGGRGSAPRSVDAPRRGDGQQQGGGDVQQPSRTRPTLQRRPPETDPVTVTPQGSPRRVDAQPPRYEPRTREAPRAEPPRSEPRSEPRVEPRSEPRSEPRAEPRSEPQSSGSSGRAAPPAESPRVRPPSE
jgi:hypothetical protein